MIKLRETIYSLLIVSLLMIVIVAPPLSAMGTNPDADSNDTKTNTVSTDTEPAPGAGDTVSIDGVTDTAPTQTTKTDLKGDQTDTTPRNEIDTEVKDVATETTPKSVIDTGIIGDVAETEPDEVIDTPVSEGPVDTEPIKGDTEAFIDASGTSGELELPSNAGNMKKKRIVQQNAFEPGEKVVLRVSYLGFTAGYIRVKVKQDTIENRPIYVLDMKARTAGAGEWFYSASDRFISYMDVKGLYSWGFDYFQNQEGEHDTQIVRYYHNKGFFAENGNRGGTIPVYTQDVLSAIYYLRTKDLKVGNKYQFPVHVDDKYYRMTISVLRSEKVATDNGWREALLLRPNIQDPSKRKEAKRHLQEDSSGVRIWVSNDKHKIPLKISLPAYFGSVYGYLHKYKSN